MINDFSIFFFVAGSVWLGILTFLTIKVYLTFSRLTKGISDQDLKSVLDEVLKSMSKNEKGLEELREKLANLSSDSLGHIQKIGLIRYNPFADTGGNQSFVLAVIDGNDDGFVITSLHSREATRVFAKPIKGGKEVGFEFSKEEIQAILEAQKKKKK